VSVGYCWPWSWSC